MADRFVFNEQFFAELGRSPGVERLVREAAGRVHAAAVGAAPRVSGDYAESLRVERSPRGGRVVYRVVAGVDYGLAVEARTGNLVRAVKAAGRG